MQKKLSLIKKINLNILTIIFLTAIYLITGIIDLDKDVINPDGINWHERTKQFYQGLINKDYKNTFPAYHPGITLMWVSGPLLEIFYDNPEFNDLDVNEKSTFLERDYFAKLSLVLFSTIIFSLCLLLLWKIFDIKFSLVFGIIFSLEPFVLGMRRLYHLDYLMTILIFLAFLSLFYFNFKKNNLLFLYLSSLSGALALLTKSSALIILILFPIIFLISKLTWKEKFKNIIFFSLFFILNIYVFTPYLWRNPIKNSQKIYEKVSVGIFDIGVDGRKEMGSSGEFDNIILEEKIGDKESLFYLDALSYRFSIAGISLLFMSISFIAFIFFKKLFDFIKNKKFNFDLLKNYENIFIGFVSCTFIFSIYVLTQATKKADRYEILIFPFLIILITYFLVKINKWIFLPLISFYLIATSVELYRIHPYYLAYSNLLFGGIEKRLINIDNSPFGIGVYEAYQYVVKDRVERNYDGYFTISGSKSVKQISQGGRFSRYPSCVTDYIITYFKNEQPTQRCTQKYTLLGTVNIQGKEYWFVYKRDNQKHESNKE